MQEDHQVINLDNRILFLSLAPSFGGGELYLYNIAMLMSQFDMHFCICNVELKTRLHNMGLPEKNVMLIQNHGFLSRLISTAGTLRHAWNIGARKIILNGIAETKYAPLFKLFGFEVFSVIHTEQYAGQHTSGRFAAMIGYWVADAIIVVASHLLNKVPKFVRKKSEIILNQVIGRFSNETRVVVGDSIREVLFIGRVEKLKGVDDIFSIAPRFPEIRFKIVGRLTDYGEKLKIGTPNNVFLIGFDTNVENHLRSADLVLFPSRSEGMPYAVLEAASIGLPMILSQIPAHVEIAGIISGMKFYEPGDVDGLHSILLSMLPRSIRENLGIMLYQSSALFNDDARYIRAYTNLLDLKEIR